MKKNFDLHIGLARVHQFSGETFFVRVPFYLGNIKLSVSFNLYVCFQRARHSGRVSFRKLCTPTIAYKLFAWNRSDAEWETHRFTYVRYNSDVVSVGWMVDAIRDDSKHLKFTWRERRIHHSKSTKFLCLHVTTWLVPISSALN